MLCLTQGVPHTEYYTIYICTINSNTEVCTRTEWKNENYLKKTTPTEEEQLSAYSLGGCRITPLPCLIPKIVM